MLEKRLDEKKKILTREEKSKITLGKLQEFRRGTSTKMIGDLICG